MEYLIFSDSHGNARGIEEVMLRQRKPPDGIFFLGDGVRDWDRVEVNGIPVYSVMGNCDAFSEDSPPSEGLISLGGHLIFYTHGNHYGVKSGNGAILRRGMELGVGIILFGHTHQPICEVIPAGETVGGFVLPNNIFLFNPGSIGSGSFGTLTIQGKTVLLGHGEI